MDGLFMAVPKGSPSTSGLTTYNKAVEWARNFLGNNHKVEEVLIMELQATAKRSSPPVMVVPYTPEEIKPQGTTSEPITHISA